MKPTLFSLLPTLSFIFLASTNAEPEPFVVECANWPPSARAECSSLHGGNSPAQPTGPPQPPPHTYGDPCATVAASLRKDCYATNHPFPIPTFPPSPPNLSGLSKFLSSFNAATVTGSSVDPVSPTGTEGWIVSTVYQAQEVTITSCAESVTNCPYKVTSSVVSWTTAVPVVPTSAAPAPPPVGTGVTAPPNYPGPAPTGLQTGPGSATTSGYIQVTAGAGRREMRAGALGVVAAVFWAFF